MGHSFWIYRIKQKLPLDNSIVTKQIYKLTTSFLVVCKPQSRQKYSKTLVWLIPRATSRNNGQFWRTSLGSGGFTHSRESECNSGKVQEVSNRFVKSEKPAEVVFVSFCGFIEVSAGLSLQMNDSAFHYIIASSHDSFVERFVPLGCSSQTRCSM